MLIFREAIAVVESLKKTRADLESKAGVYKPDELYSLLQVSNKRQFQGHAWYIFFRHVSLLYSQNVFQFYQRYQAQK